MKRSYVVMFILLSILFASCTSTLSVFNEPLEKTNLKITDFEEVENGTVESVVKTVSSIEVVELMVELESLFSNTTSGRILIRNQDRADMVAQILLLFDDVIDVINESPSAFEQLLELKPLLEKIKYAPNRYDLKIELAGTAKTEFLRNMGVLFEMDFPTENDLYIDYRDLAFTNFALDILFFFKENENELSTLLIEGASYFTGNQPFNNLFYSAVENFYWEDLTLMTKESWEKFSNLWDYIANISSPEEEVRLNDVFQETYLRLPNIGCVINLADMVMAFFIDVFGFESNYTNELGRTTYTSMYQLLAETSNHEGDISISRSLSLSANEMDISIPEGFEISINNLKITGNTRIIDLFKALEPGFLSSPITVNIAYSDEVEYLQENEIKNIGFKIAFHTKLNFPKLSQITTAKSNISINRDLLKALIDKNIWEYVSEPNNLTKETFNDLLFDIADHVAFLDIADDKSGSISLCFGDANSFALGFELMEITFWDLLNLYLN